MSTCGCAITAMSALDKETAVWPGLPGDCGFFAGAGLLSAALAALDGLEDPPARIWDMTSTKLSGAAGSSPD
jgi:hypothetical protein